MKYVDHEDIISQFFRCILYYLYWTAKGSKCYEVIDRVDELQ
jgi:hypothetical protein